MAAGRICTHGVGARHRQPARASKQRSPSVACRSSTGNASRRWLIPLAYGPAWITKRGSTSQATGRSRDLRTSGQLPMRACKMKGGISMTLTTHVRVVEPTAVKPIFDYARRLLGAESAAFEHRKHWALNNLVYANAIDQGYAAS